ncbi:MAG TPA: tRNA (adenosine(37)-N6)-threonylcarbamoyltransferase complex transferase subunit TsaD [Terriglobales bacterium]|nr:tRNA (adenosine(37)-N6)-threonylcarbamoyltransferase complex transferase subunit TsaD [Terriglobales bacterium]
MTGATILGIETSCDETAAAVVEAGRTLRSNVVLSQVPVHQIYGGVVPEVASREHLRGIVPVVRQALEQAGTTLDGVDAIAVTQGPGLAGALLVGLTYAKTLAWATGKPLVGVNHLEGHLHAVLLEERRQGRPDPPLPAVALVVSGGHTQLYVMAADEERGFRYRTLGRTRDDAAGEAYDKVGKLLGLGYPGGPLLDKLSEFGDPRGVAFGRIRLKGNPLDFSFSGLKTAVLRQVQTRPGLAAGITRRQAAIAALGRKPGLDDWRAACDQPTLDLIASFQHAVVTDLVQRTLAAADALAAAGEPPASIFLTGGVAANRVLRAHLQAEAARQGLSVYAPALNLCTDNAAMIAAAAWPQVERRLWASPALTAHPQLPLDLPA